MNIAVLFYHYYYYLFLFFYFIKISAYKNVCVTVLSVRSMTSPPHFPSVKCVAVDYDGSVWEDQKDSLRFEDGSAITNYRDYFK
jgi:hypothetical protein